MATQASGHARGTSWPGSSIRAMALLVARWPVQPRSLQGRGPPRPAPPTFEAGVEVIRLNLSVTDGRNRLITGLSESDFAVFEDGIRQDLSFFTRDPLPLSVSLLVDCSASMDEKLPVAQEAGARFVKTLRPEDLGQVVQFNDRIDGPAGLHRGPPALEAAIRRTRASGPTVALQRALRRLEAAAEARAARTLRGDARSCCSRTARTRPPSSTTSRCWSSPARPTSAST